MAISEAYRRGYKRAIAAAAELAFERMSVCDNAAKDYAKTKPDDLYWERSERCAANEGCAANEARFIWEEILKLKPKE